MNPADTTPQLGTPAPNRTTHTDAEPRAALRHVSTERLSEDLAGLARLLQEQADIDQVLDEVAAAAVRLIPGADDASITVVTGRRQATARHPTSDLPKQVDAIQTDLGEGPCLDAIYHHQTVSVPDMAHESRWPRFARAASSHGVGSMLSFQLCVEADNLGALNLYSRATDAFDDESEQIGLLFASHAAVAFADARVVEHLTVAVASRDLIGQAKGMLMERYHLSASQAFRVLVRISQHTHTKLRETAEQLTTTGTLEGLPEPANDPRPAPHE